MAEAGRACRGDSHTHGRNWEDLYDEEGCIVCRVRVCFEAICVFVWSQPWGPTRKYDRVFKDC